MTDMEKLAGAAWYKLMRTICWSSRDPSDPDRTCPCDGPEDCELVIAADGGEFCKALHTSPKELLSLIEGTHVVVPVEPTEAEIEQVARALAREDLGSNVDLSSCADEESDAEWTFYTVEARVAYKTVIAAIQGDL